MAEAGITPEENNQAAAENHETGEQVKNPLKELHMVFDEVAKRIDQKIANRPGDLWLGTDKKYALPNVHAHLQSFEDDIRAGFPDKYLDTWQAIDYDTDTPREVKWTRSRKTGAILATGANGQVVGVNQYHMASQLENDDTEYVAQQLGALKPGETIDDLKNDPSRWKVYEVPSKGIHFPGQAILPTKIEGMSLFLNEVPYAFNNGRSDVIQIDVRMDKQALDAVRKTPPAPASTSVAA